MIFNSLATFNALALIARAPGARAARAAAVVILALGLGAGSAWAADEAYIRPDQLDLTVLLAPAPLPDSLTTREDIRLMRELQAMRTPAMIALANADVERTLSRFSDVVGTDLSKARAPRANALVDKATEDAGAIFGKAKDKWHRIRPYLAFPEQIQLVVPPESSYSYPSGHATFGMATAIVLAAMVPEKAADIFARGAEFGFERTLAGVHYPSDVEAGRLAGTAIAGVLMLNPQFRTDLAAATAEVRGLLALPPLAANENAPVTPATITPAPAAQPAAK